MPDDFKSSVIKSHEYDPETRNLTVEFPNGSKHRFYDVPAEKYVSMTGNASPGSYFNSRIKGVHVSRKLPSG